MIGAELPDGRGIEWDGSWHVSDGEIPPKCGKPAMVIGAVERVENGVPVNERVQARQAPGTGAHARAVLRDLGATIILDDGDA